MNIELQPEKETILFVTNSSFSEQVADTLLSNKKIREDADAVIYLCPVVDSMIKYDSYINDKNGKSM